VCGILDYDFARTALVSYRKAVIYLCLVTSTLFTKNIAVKKILILTANPKNTDKLRLDDEVHEIEEELQISRSREQFEIISKWAVRPIDLRRALLYHDPQIVHFSGHGTGSDGLVLEGDDGQIKLVSAESLARLFGLLDNVECVLFNACYSEVQATAIHQHIDYVIGMSQAIGDRAAIEFARGFYGALVASRGYAEAFEFGLAAIALEGIPETATPKLKQRILLPIPVPAAIEVPEPVLIPQNFMPTTRSRIFISYKRGVLPDEPVALAIFNALSQHHDVFIDQAMLVGTPWAERIEAELGRADFLISFLTENSVNSEMVKGEIQTAHRLKQQQGKPQILPVRLAYAADFTYPLSAYLNVINWAFWETEADTPHLIQELQQAIGGNTLSINTDLAKTALTSRAFIPLTNIPQPLPVAQPVLLEMPEGTMDAESRFYVERSTDAVALKTIDRAGGVTITIKGPRQMGKSSLLIRIKARAEEAGKRVAYLDFQLFDQSALQDADQFYRQFCEWLTVELELENKVADYWESPLGNSLRCSRYMSRQLLKPLGSPLVLVMDEVESVFDTEFRTDFFSMLRSWHNNRATTPIWKQLDLVLVTSTEPYQLIDNLNQSPFNVGQVTELVDFDAAQVADLNQRHNSPLKPKQLQQLIDLLTGHPYLVRRALYLVASQQMTVVELFAQATADRGPFGDHLRYHLFRMNDKPDLVQGLLEVIHQQRCVDEKIFFRLRGAGLVRREAQSQSVLPRCPLYAAYFQEHLQHV
jgi:AAA-like domain/TIR domain/CHAT domain